MIPFLSVAYFLILSLLCFSDAQFPSELPVSCGEVWNVGNPKLEFVVKA